MSDLSQNPYAPPQTPLLAPQAPPSLEELAGGDGDPPVGWHDSLSHTRVVRVWRA